jgi:hypothetical protein
MKKIILLGAVALVFVAGCTLPKASITLKPDEAKAKAEKFINENLVQPDSKVTVKELKEENGLYKMKVTLSNGQEIDSFMTKDGVNFFPQVMNIKEVEDKNKGTKDKADAQAEQPKEMVKTDKPKVELFVMSYCPYGTQIEKGIIPAVQALGNKIDFNLKFCDYAMHGEKELDENTKQYCIEKNEPAKLFSYLNSFLKDGNSENAVKSAGVNVAKLNSCVSDTDKQFKIKELFKDKSKWPTGNFPPYDVFKADNTKYNVGGSPTLIINGVQSSSARDSAALLTAICSAFKNQPSECKKQLSSASPSTGFGDTAGGDSGGGCAQ